MRVPELAQELALLAQVPPPVVPPPVVPLLRALPLRVLELSFRPLLRLVSSLRASLQPMTETVT